MGLFSNLFVLALSTHIALAAPRQGCAHKVKEFVLAPVGWTRISPAPADHTISLRIGLPQPNFSVLEQHLYEISDPFHERYGAHLSKEEVESLVAPHKESIDLVNEWLSSHGFGEGNISRSPAGDWITIKVPVRVAEEMLDTKYYIWKHTESGDYLVRTTSYSLPENLHDHVEVIQPTTMFARWRGMKTTLHFEDHIEEFKIEQNLPSVNLVNGASVDPQCNVSITISCIQQLYNINGYVPKATRKNAIGITGYLEQFANEQDLQSFYADQRPDALNSSFKFISVKGGLNNQTLSEAGIEANLDVQFAFGLTYPTPGTFWSTAGRPPFKPDLTTPVNTNEPYADWVEFVLKSKNVPQTISTSYGEPEQTVPESYARRTCADFAQLGARGVSLLFSSGDGGVGDGSADPANHKCKSNDGKNTTHFLPIFPAGCPYVTAVGGTVNVPEIAVFFSGGGFSNYWPRPPYQEKAVKKFLDKLPKGTYDGLYNKRGRGIPDVAAQGRRFRIFWQGRIISIGGTSASAPTFAAIVSLLNDARLAKGKSTLGFLNPWLYSIGGSNAFNDIVEGNNPGCGTPGFNATQGWDPITGLGTPNFEQLRKLSL